MSPDLDFHSHIIKCQSRDTECSPDRLVVRAILLQASNHRLHCLVIDRQVVGAEEKHILPPAGAPGELQGVLDVVERLLDLRDYFPIDFVRFTVPTA